MAEEKSKEKVEIPTVEEMKEKAREIGKNIPNLKEKHEFMVKARGYIIEFSLIIEMCFNQLITATGKEMVFDREKKELHLIQGIRDKKTLPSLKAKSSDMKELIEKIFPKIDDASKSALLEKFARFRAIRDIFVHVPVEWNSPFRGMEFDDGLEYKHYFKLEPKWKNVIFAVSEFLGLHKWIIEIILTYNRSILLKKEILSLVLLGKSQADIQAEIDKVKEG